MADFVEGSIRKWREDAKWRHARHNRWPLDVSREIINGNWPYLRIVFSDDEYSKKCHELIDGFNDQKALQKAIGFQLHDRFKVALKGKTADFIVAYMRFRERTQKRSCGYIIGFTDISSAVMIRLMMDLSDATSYEFILPEEE
jgi:hypothetical protein